MSLCVLLRWLLLGLPPFSLSKPSPPPLLQGMLIAGGTIYWSGDYGEVCVCVCVCVCVV